MDVWQVHEEGLKIRRSLTHPLPIFDDNLKEETMKRTIYCKGFAKDGSVTLDHLLEFFKQYGPYDTVLVGIWVGLVMHYIPNIAINTIVTYTINTSFNITHYYCSIYLYTK